MNPDRLDLDPPPRSWPRLTAEVERLPLARPTSSLRCSIPTDAARRRMRLMIAVKAMMEHSPPASNQIIADTLQISESTVHRIRRRLGLKSLRRSRI